MELAELQVTAKRVLNVFPSGLNAEQLERLRKAVAYCHISLPLESAERAAEQRYRKGLLRSALTGQYDCKYSDVF